MKKFNTIMVCHLLLMAALLLFSIFAAVMMIGGIGDAFTDQHRINVVMNGIWHFMLAVSLVLGIIYIFNKYSKSAAKFYKAFLFSQFVRSIFLICINIFLYNLNFWTILSIVLLVIQAAILIILVFKKDLGKEKTWILFWILLGTDFFNALIMSISVPLSVLFYRITGALSTLVLDGTIALAIKGKYDDKESRGTK